MKSIIKLALVNTGIKETSGSLALLIFRVSASIMIMTHGWFKLQNFTTLSQEFADPIGLGGKLSLTLLTGAEFFAPLFVIAGFFTRLSLIPMVFSMSVAAFVAHASDPFQVKEMAFLYLLIFLVLLILGPGKYSADYLLFNLGRREKSK